MSFSGKAGHSGHGEDWSIAAGSHPKGQGEPGSLVGSEGLQGLETLYSRTSEDAGERHLGS